MGEFTKGPWTVTHNSWDRSTVYDADGDGLCEVQISWEADEDTQNYYEAIKDANACLIATAPELLTACEALLERYRIIVAADGPECLQAIAAIRKARNAPPKED